MRLYLNGQDINRLAIANVEDVDSLTVVDVGPERYLTAIDDFLKKVDVHPMNIKELLVVVGPGSPTALRSILAIANTMKFIYQIPTVSIKKPKDEQDLDTLNNIKNKKVEHIEQPAYLEPIYETGPKITKSKKDQLGR